MLASMFSGGISGIIKGVADVVDQFHVSDEEKHKMKMEMETHALEVMKLQMSTQAAQLEVNKAEAGHRSMFVAGWRPFVGWACGMGFIYGIMGRDMLNWIIAIVAPEAMIPPLPKPPMAVLVNVLMGMLGMAGLRTYDKVRGLTK